MWSVLVVVALDNQRCLRFPRSRVVSLSGVLRRRDQRFCCVSAGLRWRVGVRGR